MFRFVFFNYWRFAFTAALICFAIGSGMDSGGFPRAVCFAISGVWLFSAFASWWKGRNLKHCRKLGEDLAMYKSLWEQVSTLAEQRGALSDNDKAAIWKRAQCRAEAFNREFDRLFSQK